MNIQGSPTVKQWRHYLTQLPQIFALDGRTKEAKKKQAQRFFLIATATDEELEQMAKISAEIFPLAPGEILKDLRTEREKLRRTKKSWVKYLGKTANKDED